MPAKKARKKKPVSLANPNTRRLMKQVEEAERETPRKRKKKAARRR